MRPLRDRIVVRPDAINAHSLTTQIIVQQRIGMESSQEQLGRTGTVVAVGHGRKWRDVRRNGMRYFYACQSQWPDVAPGDRVLFGEWEYPKLDDLIVISEQDVIGVIE